MISYGKQDITPADIEAVVAVLRSDFLTQGPAVPRFERVVAELANVKHALAANSATSALHIACLALGLGPKDVLWTVPNTFVASANCARYCGADVDFVDIDPDTWNMSVVALEQKLSDAERRRKLPKVVVPVHFAGQPTDQEAIWKLANRYGFKVIEDASHSIGAARAGEPVGSCRWSDITIFSFHPVKIITSGEGGMALTNDDALAEQMALYRSHGITRDTRRFRDPQERADAAPWYYEQQLLGFNYRMTDIQAALGASQAGRVAEYVERRNALARRYDVAFRDLPLQLPVIADGNCSAYHLYVIRMDESATGRKRRELFAELRRHDIAANLHYLPVHLQPYYRDLGFVEGSFPHSEAYSREAITIPLFPALSTAQQDMVVSTIRSFVCR